MKKDASVVVPMRARSIRKRAAILAGAKAVFLEQGFGAASMDAISERADVSKRTIYKHFASKYDLFSAVVRRLCTNVLAEEEDFGAFKKLPVDEALLDFAVRFLREIYHPNQVDLFRTVIGEVRQFPELGAVFYDGPISASEKRLEAYFKFQMDRSGLKFAGAKHAAAQFLGLLKGDMHLRLLFMKRKRVTAREIEEQARSAVDLFLQGTLPRK
jgi:TetR/AcrR family transcriptional repressor of mexJK operon